VTDEPLVPLVEPIFKSKVYDSLCAVYTAMLDDAVEDEDENTLWIGYAKTIAEKVHASGSYVSQLFAKLQLMGSIDLVRGGKGRAVNVFRLNEPPSRTKFINASRSMVDAGRVVVETAQMIEQYTDELALTERVRQLEEFVYNLGQNFIGLLDDYVERFPDVKGKLYEDHPAKAQPSDGVVGGGEQVLPLQRDDGDSGAAAGANETDSDTEVS
jgi:DNA-binding IscR family transcriptional regulator